MEATPSVTTQRAHSGVYVTVVMKTHLQAMTALVRIIQHSCFLVWDTAGLLACSKISLCFCDQHVSVNILNISNFDHFAPIKKPGPPNALILLKYLNGT